MEDLTGWEGVSELISIADAYGYEITPIQIARWHRTGLLPRPKREFLGKGMGSKSLYPPSTHLQVLEVCAQLRESRNFLRVGWYMWRKGFEVDISVIRACLSEVRQRWRVEYDLYVDKQKGGLTEPAWDSIEAMGTKRLRPSFLSKARNRTRKEKFPSAAQAALQIAAGQFEDFDLDRRTKLTDPSETIFRKALGIDPEWKLKQDGIAPGLTEVSRINQELASKTIEDYSDEDLIQARNELAILVCGFRRIIDLGRIKLVPKETVVASANLHDLFNPIAASDQALVLWIWLLHRRTDLGKRLLSKYGQGIV
jgi:hypothetical protein